MCAFGCVRVSASLSLNRFHADCHIESAPCPEAESDALAEEVWTATEKMVSASSQGQGQQDEKHDKPIEDDRKEAVKA